MTSLDTDAIIPVLKDKTINYPLSLTVLGLPLTNEIQYLQAKYAQKSDATQKLSHSSSIVQRPPPMIRIAANCGAEGIDMTQSINTHHLLPSYASGGNVSGYRTYTENHAIQPRIHGLVQNVQCIIHLRFASQAPFFRFLLDTGSRPTWVFSTLMDRRKWERGGYNPPDGTDLVPIQVYAVQDHQQREPGGYQKYVFTFAAYEIISDDLILRAKTENQEEVRLPGLRFGAVSDTDCLIWPTFYDGVVGLGTHSDSSQLLTILERGIRHQILECPTFGVDVSFSSLSVVWNAPKTACETGTVSFGRKPSSRYNRVKVSENTNWEIPSNHKKIGDTVFTTESNILIDTGTYNIFIKDQDAVAAFYCGVPGAFIETGMWLIPWKEASNHKSWPKFSIELGDGENSAYLEIFSRNLSYYASLTNSGFIEGVLQSTEMLGNGLQDCEILGLAGIACTRLLFLYDITPWKKIRSWAEPYQDEEGKELEVGNWIYWKQKGYGHTTTS